MKKLKLRCPNCDSEFMKRIGEDGEMVKCVICQFKTDLYEAMIQYQKFDRRKNEK